VRAAAGWMPAGVEPQELASMQPSGTVLPRGRLAQGAPQRRPPAEPIKYCNNWKKLGSQTPPTTADRVLVGSCVLLHHTSHINAQSYLHHTLHHAPPHTHLQGVAEGHGPRRHAGGSHTIPGSTCAQRHTEERSGCVSATSPPITRHLSGKHREGGWVGVGVKWSRSMGG
jgi:hypothetical protein